MTTTKKRALISVSDKTNLAAFASELIHLGYELISTGVTKKFLEDNNIPVISISDVTHFPEILDGRVKTLHPHIHAALLCDRHVPEHLASMSELNIDFIDLVIVNLYPFKATISKPNVHFDEAIENIDIGGPSMLRSAAKNFKHLTVICDVQDYTRILTELKEHHTTTLATRQYLATKVFQHTSGYDTLIATYLKKQTPEAPNFDNSLTLTFDKIQDLRYGENPHQKAAFYQHDMPQPYSLASCIQLQGKELSYNNIQDAEAALNVLQEFHHEKIACVGVKHANPCGVALGGTSLEAWIKTLQADAVSIFGGIVGFNGLVDATTAEQLNTLFLEIVIAPDFSADALRILGVKKNLRVLKISMAHLPRPGFKISSIVGGLLVQDEDRTMVAPEKWQVVTKTSPTPAQIDDMMLGLKVVKHVKSNAIVVAAQRQTVGISAGQMNRIGSAKLALDQAKAAQAQNMILASDAFFPFSDVVQLAHQYGIKAIVQPGGSIKDQDSIDACNELNMPMVFTQVRHFKH